MMSVNEHVLVLAAMATAIVAILAIGILVAADIIHVGPRQAEPVRESRASAPRPEERSSNAA